MNVKPLETISISDIKKNKKIKNFEDFKQHLANNILIYLQFDLPREFNLVDVASLPYNYRFMRNFSKTLSYNKSVDLIKNELATYGLQAKKTPKMKKFDRTEVTTTFKQVFFDIESIPDNKLILDDITDFNLQKTPTELIKGVITDIPSLENERVPLKENQDKEHVNISSKKVFMSSKREEKSEDFNTIDQPEVIDLMKGFSLEINPVKQVDASSESIDLEEHQLNEAFKLLGLGNIKKNLGKTIITKKKPTGLLFDEWVTENLSWVQFLIKKLAHIEYLSLKEESEYLNIARNYQFSGTFEFELKMLFRKLHVDGNE